MQRILSSLIVFGAVQVGAEPMVEGHVRLASGEPVAGAHVRLFDMSDLRSWVGATTDETGYFALPVAALPGAAVQPARFHLGSNYPNPFNPSTVIPYHLHRPMPVRLEVFNVLGQRIATLVDGQQSEGFHTARWDGTNAAGQAVAAGIYLYRLSGEGGQATRSMVLIDGQAGIPAGSAGRLPQAGAEATEAASVYGLTVSGPGMVPFVDPAFRVGLDPMELVVEASAGMARAKASSGPCRVLGDVDNNGQVGGVDALLVLLYSGDPSTVLPNNGDISLGDVNADGRIDFTDAYLIAAWLTDASDPTLPAGIGAAIGEAACSDDRAVLVALYEATDGDNWENNTQWLSDKPLDEWFGVTTDDDGRVTYLELRENALSGELPASLGNLTKLQRLELFGNDLSGALPSSLVNLTNLKHLNLGYNALSGELPASLGNLTQLQYLNLASNQFSGELPAWLGNLTQLRRLFLSKNSFSGELPAWLGNLTQLQSLDLYDNDFSGGVPAWLGNLTQLGWLTLARNDFSGELPASLGKLTNLQGLWLNNTQLSGALPDELVNLTKLYQLYLGNTQLCAPPDAAFQRWLQGIGDKRGMVNCIEDRPVSPDRAMLVVLYEATDGDNWTNDTHWLSDRPLNEWFGVTTDENGRVTRLNLFRNRLSGSLPSALGHLTHLQWLGLYDNELSGSLPSSLGNLTNLQSLDLGENDFSGSLPSSLGHLTHLEDLYLDNTQLCAPLDAGFQTWLQGIENKQGVVDCPEVKDDRPTEEDDRAQLAEMRREIDALIGDAVGASIEDCRSMGLGDKPCGGPWEYVIYSVSSTDSTALAERATAYNAFEEEMNRRYWYSSDCAYEMAPMLVYRDGRCLVLTFEDYLAQLAEMRREFVAGVAIEPVVLPGAGVRKPPLTYSLSGIPPGLSFDAETRTLSGTPTVAGTYEVTFMVEDYYDDSIFWTDFTLIVIYSEQAILVALYEATDGDNWNNSTNWLSDEPLDEWFGVTTDENGRVTHLELAENGLSGSLPSSLGDLAYLEVLTLFKNELSGPLPASLVNLTNLEELWLDNTQLCAPIDAVFQEWLGDIDNKEGVVNCSEKAIRFVEGVAIEPMVLPGVPEGAGTPPYTYSVSGLPEGLSFDPETRTLSGTPTVAGRYEVTYRVEDFLGDSAEMPLIVIVEPSDE